MCVSQEPHSGQLLAARRSLPLPLPELQGAHAPLALPARDTHDLPFWMALLHGRKRWRVFKHNDEVLLQDFRPEAVSMAVLISTR